MVVSSSPNSKTNHHHHDARGGGGGGGGGIGGLGLFLVFFHHIHIPPCIHSNKFTTTTTTTSSSSITPNTNTNTNASSKRSPSSSFNLLLSKTQSTLSICALLFFTTLLFFTLSSFEPSSSSSSSSSFHNHNHNHGTTTTVTRRFLQDRRQPLTKNVVKGLSIPRGIAKHLAALQGMGHLYLRGSKSMTDLLVGHISDDATAPQIRSFIRVVSHSGLLSRTDLVLLFPSPALSKEFQPLLRSECDSLLRLIQLGSQLGRGELGHGLTRYFRAVGEGGKEPLWGRRGNSTTSVGESTRPSYGSVVGFDASELDPENSLSGFLDEVPMRMRRWACYPMLLGRVRRNFKHMGLVDVKDFLLLSDPFTRVRNKSSETVLIWSNSDTIIESTRHGRKRNSVKPHTDQLNAGVIVGGSRGVRRFADAALTEIVRQSVEHKGRNRNSVTESGVVNQLVHSGHVLKSRSINFIKTAESIPDTGLLSGFDSGDPGSGYFGVSEYLSVVQRGGNDVDNVIMREICSSHKLVSAVYTDCLAGNQL